jgi:iron(III) transport system ATP-binding protein
MMSDPVVADRTTQSAAPVGSPSVRPTVELHAVGKRYANFAAVRDISLDIAGGTLVTLLGPSGCGKTTTLRLIAGLEHPTAGHILIDGKDVTHLSAAERDVSMVFQSYALFPHMTVLQNTCYGLMASGVKKADARTMAMAKLATVGLAGFENRLPSELSGGQQQRVAVARAIVLEPKVLLFDEPLSNLDAKLRRRVREDIRSLQQNLGLTVVYVTHDQEEALAVSDRIVVMRAGEIVQDGTPRQLYENPVDRFIADFIGNANLLPVTVTRLQEDVVDVTLAGVTLQMPRRDLPLGPALLAVRPQDISIRARQGNSAGLIGHIGKSAYLGSHMEYEVTMESVGVDVFVINGNVLVPLPPGTEVDIIIAPGGAALVPVAST